MARPRAGREVFEGIGYDTTLTRSTKDGGFDLELRFRADGSSATYLVEVKHWSENKPGLGHLRKSGEGGDRRLAAIHLRLHAPALLRPCA